MLGRLVYLGLLMLEYSNMSDKASSAVNQQATLSHFRMGESSETIRQAPLSKREIKDYLLGAIHDGTLNRRKKLEFRRKEMNG